MPDVQEVFRMATQKVRPEPGFVDRQQQNQRRRNRNRRTGAYVLAAGLGIAVVIVVIRVAGEGVGTQPAIQPPPPVAVPEVDSLLDLETGEMTALPKSIAGENDGGSGYAVSPDGRMLAYSAAGSTAPTRSSSPVSTARGSGR